MLKLLIAVDGSDHSRRAIDAAARLAAQVQEVQVLILNVGDGAVFYGEMAPLDYDALEHARQQLQRQLLDEAEAHARASGLQHVSTLAALGVTATEIARVAEEQGVDQIVMGTHGKGALGSLFLGSTAQRVVHLSTVPVLLVK
jgi:nucleotide-binding universal stress UspA family protein